MKNCKCLLIAAFIVLECFPQAVHSQELRPIMKDFKTLCLSIREALARQECDSIKKYRDKIVDFKKDFSVKGFKPTLLTNDDKQISLKCEEIFNVSYIDSLYNCFPDCSPYSLDNASNIRGDDVNSNDSVKLSLCYKAIPAGKTMLYKFTGSEDMDLVLITAERQEVELTVSYLGKSYEVESTKGSVGVKTRAWTMPKESNEITLKIKNPNNNTVTCVIAVI